MIRGTQFGNDHGFMRSSEPILCAHANPLKATAFRPCPGKHESPTQKRFLIPVLLKGIGSNPGKSVEGIGPYVP